MDCSSRTAESILSTAESVAVATGVIGAEELARHSPDLLVADMRSLTVEMLVGK